jgi:polar amino acid transport system substrate-binding protein
MRDIQRHGSLIAGVDENTLGLSARNTLTGEDEGLEVAIVREIARAIFGNSEAIQLKSVVTSNKTAVVSHDEVNLTVSAVSMRCNRLKDVDFSSEYFTAPQKLLVRSDSDISGSDDLAGRKVCVTKGSTSIGVLNTVAPRAIQVPVDARSDCLLALEKGRADAYLSHDSILIGMQRQDPTTKILPERLSLQHYGIAIPKGHPEFVRFVNAVLERMRADRTLARLYQKWLGSHATPPAPEYRDAG